MDNLEIIHLIFGGTIVTAVAAFIAITANLFNIKDRLKRWLSEKKKSKFKKAFLENNPDFKFSLNFISNPQPGKCTLNITLLNTSKEVKYIESLNYKFLGSKNTKRHEPSALFTNGEKWPKRLEHGERFSTSVDFSATLANVAFQYWRKGFSVYCISKSTTGDLLRSNKVDFDKLMGFLEPLNENYINLATLLAKKTGGSKVELEISLWQLQFFKRLTVHIGKQLQQNNIPIAEYLIGHYGLIAQKDFWYYSGSVMDQRKIQPNEVEGFLKSLL